MHEWHVDLMKHAHECMRDQINLADAKVAGILAWDAAMVAMLAGVGRAQQSDILLFLLGLAAAFVIASVILCASALTPRTPTAGEKNPFSCVDLARRSRNELLDEFVRDEITKKEKRLHACALVGHVHVLSEIAAQKFEHISWAVRLAAAASVVLILYLAVGFF